MNAPINRMVINAAIETLMAQTDQDGTAAETVIEYGSRLSNGGRITFEFNSDKSESGGETKGYTPEHGNITIKDSPRMQHTERTYGFQKERIGYFRLWKESEGTLNFHHFWKSSSETAPEENARPDIYRLGYDQHSLAFQYLGIHRRKITKSIGWLGVKLEFVETYLEPVCGNVPRLRGGGFQIVFFSRRK